MECKNLKKLKNLNFSKAVFLPNHSEDDLSEVLQIEEIFSNAIQGEIAAD